MECMRNNRLRFEGSKGNNYPRDTCIPNDKIWSEDNSLSESKPELLKQLGVTSRHDFSESKLRNGVQPAESANSNLNQETTFKQEDYAFCTNKLDICSVDGQQNAQGCEQSEITVDLLVASYQNPVQENIATVGKCPSKLVVSGNSDEELIANPLSNKGDVWQNVHTGINTPEKIINLSEQRQLTVHSPVDVTSDERAIFEHAGVEGGKYARVDKKMDYLSADLDHKPKKQPSFPIAPQTPASAVVDSNCYSLFPTPTKIKRSSCALLANDETIPTVYRTTFNIDTDMIRLISQTVSSISSVLRVTETLNNLKVSEIDLVPYLGIDFAMATYASVEKVNFKNILDAEVIKACFESSNQVLKRYPCHSLLGKYTVRYTLYRGDAKSMDVIASITVVETKQNILFWDWCLSNFNAETSYPPATKTKTIRPFKNRRGLRVAPLNKSRKAKDKQDIHIPNTRPQYLATLFEKCAQWLYRHVFVWTLVICCVLPICSSTETQTTGQYFGQEVVLHEQSPTQVEDLSEAEQCVDSDFSSGEASAVTTGRESNSSPFNDPNLGRGAEGGSDLPVSTGFGHHGKISYGDNNALHGLLDQESFYGDQNDGEAEGLVLFEGLRLNNGRYDENMHFAKEGQPRRGAYGEVSFGVDIQSGKPFAVKKIPIGEFNRREPRILNLCDNPNVIKLYGLIRRGNCIEIIMEKATNGTWFEMILNGPLQQQETLQCLLGALTGLEQLHRCSIIHRDLKPNNIGLMADGRVVILDLGSAITPDDTQDFVGITRLYAAPEVCGPPYQCTPKMDIWSLGCCALFLILGNHHWNNWQEVRHYLDRISFDCPGFKELLFGMLERDPNKRWDTKTCLSHIRKMQTTFEDTERRAGMSARRAIPDTVEGFDAEDDLATDTPDQPDEPTSEAASGPLGDPPNGSQANRNNENRGPIT